MRTPPMPATREYQCCFALRCVLYICVFNVQNRRKEISAAAYPVSFRWLLIPSEVLLLTNLVHIWILALCNTQVIFVLHKANVVHTTHNFTAVTCSSPGPSPPSPPWNRAR